MLLPAAAAAWQAIVIIWIKHSNVTLHSVYICGVADIIVSLIGLRPKGEWVEFNAPLDTI